MTPLPTPKKKGRPFGSKNAPKEVAKEVVGEVASKITRALENEVRELPEDAGELDKALAPYRIYARMPVKALSGICEYFETDKLDKDETDAGVDAVAMCFYQYSAKMNCWFALSMFALSIASTRIPQYLSASKAKKARRPALTTVVDPSQAVGGA